MHSQQNNASSERENRMPPADTGNASNPSPNAGETQPAGNNQLLNEKAEKYLRESGTIEDMPDEQDWQEAEKSFNREEEK